MFAVKHLCQKIDNTFLLALRKPSLAAAYLLANLYRTLAKASAADKRQMKMTLRALQCKLKANDIQTLWQRINTIKPTTWQVLDPDSQVSLNLLKRAMLRDPIYLRALTPEALLSLGQSVDWYREVFIALVRQHCSKCKGINPFSEEKFNYTLLRSAGAEQNFLYVSSFIAKCKSLPIASILELGSQHSKVAELIMKDLTNSNGYFSVAAGFARKHASLRKRIAKDWQRHLATYPLSSHDEDFLQKTLPLLQQDFPEFRKVVIDARMPRHYETKASVLTDARRLDQRHFSMMVILPWPVALFQFVRRQMHNPPRTNSVFTSFARRFGNRR